MQRATLSVLRNCIGGTAQLETTFQRALSCSYTTSSFGAAGNSSSLPTPALKPSAISGLAGSALLKNSSHGLGGLRFASDIKPEVPGNTVDNWAAMREDFNKERASSLGANYYLNVLTMGFAYWLNESYYFPPRTLYIGGLVFAVLYVRKGFFTTHLQTAQNY